MKFSQGLLCIVLVVLMVPFQGSCFEYSLINVQVNAHMCTTSTVG
jgi:hypothetical protein